MSLSARHPLLDCPLFGTAVACYNYDLSLFSKSAQDIMQTWNNKFFKLKIFSSKKNTPPGQKLCYVYVNSLKRLMYKTPFTQ